MPEVALRAQRDGQKLEAQKDSIDRNVKIAKYD